MSEKSETTILCDGYEYITFAPGKSAYVETVHVSSGLEAWGVWIAGNEAPGDWARADYQGHRETEVDAYAEAIRTAEGHYFGDADGRSWMRGTGGARAGTPGCGTTAAVSGLGALDDDEQS